MCIIFVRWAGEKPPTSRPSRDLIGTLRPILHQRVCSSSVWRLALSLGQCSQWGQPWGRRMKRTTAVEGFGRSHLQDGKVGEHILQFSNSRIDYMRFTMFIFVQQLFKMIWWSSFSLPHHHTSQGSKGIKKSSGGSPPPDHQPVFLGHVRRQWCVRLMAFWPRALSLACEKQWSLGPDKSSCMGWEKRKVIPKKSGIMFQVRPEVMMKGV